MSHLEWKETLHGLQAGPMDNSHQAFVSLTNALADAADADELSCLTQLFVHCKEHFAQEELWMKVSHMPSTENHIRDHEGVLTLLESAAAELRAGHAGAGRDLVDSLVTWFGRHVSTMDAGLAFHMQQSKHSAKPGIPAVG
jgi:hemerythrin-like metal-binding protein